MKIESDIFGGSYPPTHELSTEYIHVNGREEHESFLNDPKKCSDYGLDIAFERMVYLKRWGGFLNENSKA